VSADRCTRQLAGRPSQSGFTVVEVMLVVILIGAVSAWAMPAFLQRLQRTTIEKAILDINSIQAQIEDHFNLTGGFPDSLADLYPPVPPDPWGNPYQYLNSGDPGWRGKFRKDRFLVPLNSDYDLYSLGPDGQSRPPLTVPVSHDDIIRANNGGFIGPASEF
jgi:general secretion pathway protein G